MSGETSSEAMLLERRSERSLSRLGAPLMAQSLSDKVVEILVEAIERGELAPGDRIREAVLAREMGISRGPLREALHRLEGRKLLQYTPNLGMRVATVSNKDIVEIFQIREMLEGLACRLATENMTDGEIDDLDRLLDSHRHAPDLSEGSAYYQRAGELDIHYRIAVGSRNDRLVELLCRDLYHFVRVHRFKSSFAPGRAERAFAEHKIIVEVMRRRDPDEAERIMRQHIRGARENLVHAGEAEGTAAS